MKKLLCIALFSIAIMANANSKKEIAVTNSDETEISTSSFLEIENSNFMNENFELDVDCGAEGDLYYTQLREAGLDHREARSERRDFVRDCRGGTLAWIGVCIGFIGHCD